MLGTGLLNVVQQLVEEGELYFWLYLYDAWTYSGSLGGARDEFVSQPYLPVYIGIFSSANPGTIILPSHTAFRYPMGT